MQTSSLKIESFYVASQLVNQYKAGVNLECKMKWLNGTGWMIIANYPARDGKTKPNDAYHRQCGMDVAEVVVKHCRKPW